tara:strand:+ start:2168 stop:2617 length:450 start_codon:yes stop_codon:yes gene_type:complete
MARHIIFNNLNKKIGIVETDEAKNWWMNYGAESSVEISDSDYEAVVITLTKKFEDVETSSTIIDNSDVPSHEITKEMCEEKIQELIKNIDHCEKKWPNVPSTWSGYKSTLENINLDSISWPVTASVWLDALHKNGISVPSPAGEIPCAT